MKKINSIPARSSVHTKYQKLLTGKLILSRTFYWVFSFKISTAVILNGYQGRVLQIFRLLSYLKTAEFKLRLSFLWGAGRWGGKGKLWRHRQTETSKN